jgi:RHS repeat-associated protein
MLMLGWAYFGGRFYDPEIGRFILMDPAKDGLNWFIYCNDNPINNIDPDGRAYEATKTFAATG